MSGSHYFPSCLQYLTFVPHIGFYIFSAIFLVILGNTPKIFLAALQTMKLHLVVNTVYHKCMTVFIYAGTSLLPGNVKYLHIHTV